MSQQSTKKLFKNPLYVKIKRFISSSFCSLSFLIYGHKSNPVRLIFVQYHICSSMGKIKRSLYHLLFILTSLTFKIRVTNTLRSDYVKLRSICVIFKYQEGCPIWASGWTRTNNTNSSSRLSYWCIWHGWGTRTPILGFGDRHSTNWTIPAYK